MKNFQFPQVLVRVTDDCGHRGFADASVRQVQVLHHGMELARGFVYRGIECPREMPQLLIIF